MLSLGIYLSSVPEFRQNTLGATKAQKLFLSPVKSFFLESLAIQVAPADNVVYKAIKKNHL